MVTNEPGIFGSKRSSCAKPAAQLDARVPCRASFDTPDKLNQDRGVKNFPRLGATNPIDERTGARVRVQLRGELGPSEGISPVAAMQDKGGSGS
jgi:hypothetical protein